MGAGTSTAAQREEEAESIRKHAWNRMFQRRAPEPDVVQESRSTWKTILGFAVQYRRRADRRVERRGFEFC